MELDSELIRKNLIFIRCELCKLSIEKFSNRMNIPSSTYHRLEKDDYSKDLKLEYINTICRLEDISIYAFLFTKLTYDNLKVSPYEKNDQPCPNERDEPSIVSPPAVKPSKWKLVLHAAFLVVIILLATSGNGNADAGNTGLPAMADFRAYAPEYISTETGEPFVYITSSGRSYHKDADCRHIASRSFGKILLSEAEVARYIPCDDCAK